MARDWSTYWRSAGDPLEAMHAHFERHVYHRHSHDSYSFGVTEAGVQAFTCRGAAHTSAAGMVMAFNPDDPHDGRALDSLGFTYRMIHIGPELVTAVLAGLGARPAGLPLFADPVVADPGLAGSLRALNRALLSGASPLRRDELLAGAVRAMVRRSAGAGALAKATAAPPGARVIAGRARQVLHDLYRTEITSGALAAAVGCSRFTVHRAFKAVYGTAPSDYQRQLRLRAARRLIAQGRPISEAAAQAGFADQSHLSRWFTRCYGITPGGYQRAVARVAEG